MKDASPEQIEEALIELAYTWGDIEEVLDEEDWNLTDAVGKAFRVEAQYELNGWGDDCTPYVLFFDVADKEARDAAMLVQQSDALHQIITEKSRTWHTRDNMKVRVVPRGVPAKGQVCRRMLETHPPSLVPDLTDLPDERPDSEVPLVKRDQYWLTPIELPFYDALRETGLFFAVQPWIQGTDRRYRLDFLVWYDGGTVAVELDGHEYHKTKEQRRHDAERDRWFMARGVRTLRCTGSEVNADPQGCVKELLDVLRGTQARP